MYQHILVPTDGSEAVESAIRQAIDLARDLDAHIHALYVVDTATATAVPETQWSTMEDVIADAGRRALEAVASEAEAAGVPVTTAIRHGSPHEQILAATEAEDIDLVVMGTHGRSGLDRVLLGSVTEKVIRRSNVPVLVTRITE